MPGHYWSPNRSIAVTNVSMRGGGLVWRRRFYTGKLPPSESIRTILESFRDPVVWISHYEMSHGKGFIKIYLLGPAVQLSPPREVFRRLLGGIRHCQGVLLRSNGNDSNGYRVNAASNGRKQGVRVWNWPVGPAMKIDQWVLASGSSSVSCVLKTNYQTFRSSECQLFDCSYGM